MTCARSELTSAILGWVSVNHVVNKNANPEHSFIGSLSLFKRVTRHSYDSCSVENMLGLFVPHGLRQTSSTRRGDSGIPDR
jgi:hypothetical protein